MSTILFVQQALIYIHLFTFVYAISSLLTEDFKIMKSRQINIVTMKITAKRISIALAILWITGIALLSIKPGLDLNLILNNPKLLMKLMIVTILTINGLLLHYYVFPLFSNPFKVRRSAVIFCLLGTISTSSWIYASLVGAAHKIAPVISFQWVLSIYIAMLVLGFILSLILFYPFLKKMNICADNKLGYSLQVEVKQLIKVLNKRNKQVAIATHK
jgi:hypothetical protein